MDITVNGVSRSMPEQITVDRLVVELLGRDPAGIAVAVNGTVIPRTSWAQQTVSSGDSVEIVTALQGG